MLAFLCGAMEYAADGGRLWRAQLGDWLRQNLHHQVYDPTLEAQRLLSAEELERLEEGKRTDWAHFQRLMRTVINRDLEVISTRASYLICYWDEAASRGGGSQAELTLAYRQGLPVFLVSEVPREEISGWVLGCVDRMFTSFDELKNFLVAAYGENPQQREFWEGAGEESAVG